jgi:aminoglycoside phosphotransferase (APT) family kinase protein
VSSDLVHSGQGEGASLLRRLQAFLSEQTGEEIAVKSFARHTVGYSWLTFSADVECRKPNALPVRSLILKLGPDTGLYAPYSAAMQTDALIALEKGPAAVPRVFWRDDDRRHFGLPFFICERMPGEAPVPKALSADDPVTRFRPLIAKQFISTLARLHGFAWERSNLKKWGANLSVENAALAQVDWCDDEYRRITAEPVPTIPWALHWLRRHAPRAPRLSLLHGDFRIGNFLVVGSRITAFLDWESAHLGDPHEDLAWAALPQFGGRSGMVCRLAPAAEFLAAYEKEARWRPSPASLRYYTVMGLLKLALVNLAALRRSQARGAQDIRMAALGTQLPSSLRQLQKTIQAVS